METVVEGLVYKVDNTGLRTHCYLCPEDEVNSNGEVYIVIDPANKKYRSMVFCPLHYNSPHCNAKGAITSRFDYLLKGLKEERDKINRKIDGFETALATLSNM